MQIQWNWWDQTIQSSDNVGEHLLLLGDFVISSTSTRSSMIGLVKRGVWVGMSSIYKRSNRHASLIDNPQKRPPPDLLFFVGVQGEEERFLLGV